MGEGYLGLLGQGPSMCPSHPIGFTELDQKRKRVYNFKFVNPKLFLWKRSLMKMLGKKKKNL